MNKSIEALPVATQNRLRSTQILTSLPQVVSELLQNALDAGARHVDIGVDRDDWSCWVRDDGHGISKDNMFLLGQGSEQGRYATSKAYDPDSLNVLSSFGFRGEALASAADLSCLEIASRTATSRETWSMILKGGEALYTGPAVRWRRETSGTTVVVRDAFYNLPVRRLSHPPTARTFDMVRQEVETYALIFPEVSFSVERSREATDNTFRIPKTPSTLLTFRHLFGKALVEYVEQIDITSDDLKLEGFISLGGAQSNVHVNKHPIGRGEFHKLIETKFSASSFAKHAYDESGETSVRSTVRRSPRKIEKRPVYVLNLTVSPRHLDNCLEPAKMNLQFQNKNSVMALLSTTIQSFLVRHGFSTHPSATNALRETSPSPRKRRRCDPEGDSGYAEAPSAQLEEDDVLDTEHSSAPLFIRHEHSLQVPTNVLWTDPSTGHVFVIDSRTGNSRPPAKFRHGAIEETEDNQASRLTFPRQKEYPTNKEMPVWIQDALLANDVFSPTETKIPSVKSTNANLGLESQGNGVSHGCHNPSRSSGSAQQDALTLGMTAHRYRKTDLLNAYVINQVDRKFIACLISGTSHSDIDGTVANGTGRALVFIDQHAADERIRVEQFLKPLCLGFLESLRAGTDKGRIVEMRELSPGVPVLLTSYEASKLATGSSIQRAFQRWGFGFGDLGTVNSIADGVTQSGYVQVIVKSVPEVVADKLLLGNELRDLVKAYLADPKIPEDSHDVMLSGSAEDSAVWLKALRWCPRELLDLVNSKACRGAIMFNDSLTIEQCQKLVRQLADTVFPFQCAHGRPSLVPLFDISRTANTPNGAELSWSRLVNGTLD
ncbi:hypothetical protein CPB85DRAFT_1495878 [Mucidula mucida]|nr:hypothetical protein CPB85DRAFT_1495878 [Mucidula mucida]